MDGVIRDLDAAELDAREGVQLMEMLDAIYKSSETGRSVEIK